MSFTPFHTNAPNVSGGGGSPLLMGLLSAIASLPAQEAQKKKAAEESQVNQAALKHDQLTTQQLQQQIDTGAQTNANQQFQNLYKTAQTMPDWQKSPAIRSQLDKLAKDAGMPANPAYNADGSWNGSFGLQPISSMPINAQTDNFRNELLAKQPGAERENYAKSFGVYIPKDDPMLTAKPTYTTKASNDITKTAQQGVHYANADKTAAARATALGVLSKARADEAEGKTSLERIQADNYVRIQNDKLAIAHQNADAHTTEAAAATSRAQNAVKAMGGGNQKLAATFHKQGMESIARAERAAAGFDAAVDEAQGAGADDSVLQPLLQKQAQARAQLQTAKTQLGVIQSELGANTGDSNNIRTASGARKVTVTTLGGGDSKFTVGQVYTDAKGNRAKYNGPNSWSPVP